MGNPVCTKPDTTDRLYLFGASAWKWRI